MVSSPREVVRLWDAPNEEAAGRAGRHDRELHPHRPLAPGPVAGVRRRSVVSPFLWPRPRSGSRSPIDSPASPAGMSPSSGLPVDSTGVQSSEREAAPVAQDGVPYPSANPPLFEPAIHDKEDENLGLDDGQHRCRADSVCMGRTSAATTVHARTAPRSLGMSEMVTIPSGRSVSLPLWVRMIASSDLPECRCSSKAARASSTVASRSITT